MSDEDKECMRALNCDIQSLCRLREALTSETVLRICRDINNKRRELVGRDHNFIYFAMESVEAERLFARFCDDRHVTSEVVRVYSYKYDCDVERIRVRKCDFEDVRLNENTPITSSLMRELLT